MRQCDDETRHSLTSPSVCTFVNFIDTNKSAFTPPADRKIIPCLGKICALPRKIFFLLIPAKAPSPPPFLNREISLHRTPVYNLPIGSARPTHRLRTMSAHTPQHPSTHSATSFHALRNILASAPYTHFRLNFLQYSNKTFIFVAE